MPIHTGSIIRKYAAWHAEEVPDVLDVSVPGVLEQEPRRVPHLDVLEDHRSQFTGPLTWRNSAHAYLDG